MFICVAGKNDIAVNILKYLIKNQNRRYELGIVCNKTEIGKDSWQRSLRYCAKENNIREYSLEEVYNIPELIFLSMEFDQIIRPNLFKDARLYNIHFSLLPAYKGMYTSVFPILNGEKEVGVTFHEIDAGIDTGRIIKQKYFELKEEYNCRDLYLQYIQHGIKLVIDCLEDVISNNVFSFEQPVKNSSYYSKKTIDYSEIKIDLIQTADNIKKQIRAFGFREYQLPIVWGKRIIDVGITRNRSKQKAGTVICENDQGMMIATVDYDIVLFYDRLDELMQACKMGNLNTVKDICNVKRHINEKDSHGWTPLIVATYYGRKDIVEFLLMQGADLHITNYNGTNLLMYAKEAYVLSGDNSIFKMLYKCGLNEFTSDYKGNDLLYYLKENKISLEELLN